MTTACQIQQSAEFLINTDTKRDSGDICLSPCEPNITKAGRRQCGMQAVCLQAKHALQILEKVDQCAGTGPCLRPLSTCSKSYRVTQM